MNNVLPFIAIAVAVAALALSPAPETKTPKSAFLSIALGVVALAAGYFWRNDYNNLLPGAVAFAIGVLCVTITGLVEGSRVGSGTAAAGLAAGLSGLAHWADPTYLPAVQLGLVAGVALGAWCTAGMSASRFSLPLGTALFTGAFVAGDFMGFKALANEPGGNFGTMLGLAIAIAGLVGFLAGRSEKRTDGSLAFIPGWLAVALLLAFGYVVGGRYLEGSNAWMIFDGAVLTGAILNWVIRPTGKDDSLAFLVSAVIWIGLATLAFSYQKGFGMAIGLAGAMAVFLVLGNTRAMLSAGPLLGLVFYRVLREAFPEATRALDIGQHYAVIGVAFGLVIALLPVDWVRTRQSLSATTLTGRIVWALILALLPAALAVVLGAKGMVGFVAGLGFAALVDGIRGGSSLVTLVLASGLAAVTTLSYGWLANLLDMTRETKQVAFYWIAGVGIALAVVLSLFSKSDSQPESQLQ